ncbi:rab-GTPase-TBC domain-containing protein [Dioszegia hungarica]|uniref:Rab-GTPase-TBC domain-containing protein n=1 Tax=Dioszegia hungarica TaxID=4972 RepID=A0AA38LWT6_9TREE|nr:rab-GTPase-TBC domain-containing protein [Dioszegia hungarica]KAI9636676.1 rab-GTPase-TBC domain-containing protein [Dioszegia hungarica]
MEEEKTAPSISWIDIREKVVEQALTDGDYEALRRMSALPGGFGGEGIRRRVWPVLLQTDRFCSEATRSSTSDEAVHEDEGQVGLDTNRSFVVYPTGIVPERKKAMQADLYNVIVGVLRRYPTLSYFQGYHDILSVFYLTYISQPAPDPLVRSRTSSRNHSRSTSARPETEREVGAEAEKVEDEGSAASENSEPRDSPEWEILRKCAEVVSVLRVRDAMGSGMEGMMGMLRLLKRILRAADPELSRFSSQISPVPTLPFFALSWILCLFSHDIDTLEPVQRMFDFLLARNPISAIYLAVAILIAKKPQMMVLAAELGPEAADDPSLLHPLFSRLPPLYPDTPDQTTPPSHITTDATNREGDNPNPYRPIPLSELFSLADRLMLEHPWDGPEIRGQEIMGQGSVVMSYEKEMAPRPLETGVGDKAWTLVDALQLVDQEVVKPGAGMMDDEEEDEDEAPVPVRKPGRRVQRRRWLLRLGRNKLGTAVAVGVVVLGVGMAVFGVKAGGPHASWARWWAAIVGKQIAGSGAGGRVGDRVDTAAEAGRYLARCLRGIM